MKVRKIKKALNWITKSLNNTFSPANDLRPIIKSPIPADAVNAIQITFLIPLKGFFDSFKSFSRSLGSKFKVKFR